MLSKQYFHWVTLQKQSFSPRNLASWTANILIFWLLITSLSCSWRGRAAMICLQNQGWQQLLESLDWRRPLQLEPFLSLLRAGWSPAQVGTKILDQWLLYVKLLGLPRTWWASLVLQGGDSSTIPLQYSACRWDLLSLAASPFRASSSSSSVRSRGRPCPEQPHGGALVPCAPTGGAAPCLQSNAAS